MITKYQQWIAENVDGNGYGQCLEVTLQMQHAFPELQRIKGHYYCAIWGERCHWWLQTADGEVVDPTAMQFPSKGTGVYVPLCSDEPEPIGRCVNCGEYCYNDPNFCSSSCELSAVSFLNHGI